MIETLMKGVPVYWTGHVGVNWYLATFDNLGNISVKEWREMQIYFDVFSENMKSPLQVWEMEIWHVYY